MSLTTPRNVLAERGSDGCESLLKYTEKEKEDVVGSVNGNGIMALINQPVRLCYAGPQPRGCGVPLLLVDCSEFPRMKTVVWETSNVVYVGFDDLESCNL